jgi:hypothetical protein
MAQKKKAKSSSKGNQKTFASKRTMNPTGGPRQQADTRGTGGDQEHDEKNRLGSFAGKGEHARTGNPGHQ